MNLNVKHLIVEIDQPTELGRLYPRYDQESGILVAENPIRRDWPYGVDIDGTVVFDLDKDRRLANVDMMLRREIWEVSDDIVSKKPSVLKAGDIVFSPEAIHHKSFSLPIKVLTNKRKTKVLVLFGPSAEGTQAIEMSRQCLVLVRATILLGFWINLKSK